MKEVNISQKSLQTLIVILLSILIILLLLLKNHEWKAMWKEYTRSQGHEDSEVLDKKVITFSARTGLTSEDHKITKWRSTSQDLVLRFSNEISRPILEDSKGAPVVAFYGSNFLESSPIPLQVISANNQISVLILAKVANPNGTNGIIGWGTCPGQRVDFHFGFFNSITMLFYATPAEKVAIGASFQTEWENKWIHVAYQRLGALLRIYVNGALKAEEIAPDKTDDFTQLEKLRIGTGNCNEMFTGKIAEVRFYNHFLKDEERQRSTAEMISYFDKK